MATPAAQALEKRDNLLPESVARRGINEAQWRTLCSSLYPGANPNSVLLVWDYCAARKLDPLKKPCHIVPMEVKDAKTGNYEWRDVVMPGIYELRTTAQRTGEYMGHPMPVFGPYETHAGVLAPEWCEFTAKRWNPIAGLMAEFPVRVLFREVVAMTRDKKTQEYKANSRWAKAPVQMLVKCSEAAALREAFPDELGGQQTAEEMDGQRAADRPALEVPANLPKPDGFDEWFERLRVVSKEGEKALTKAWADADEAMRNYLTITDPDAFESLKNTAIDAEIVE